MQVKFKGKNTSYQTTTPIEQKLYRGGVSTGWLLVLSLTGELNSTELDELLTTESISEITFISDKNETTVLTGYNSVSSCVIKYADEKTVAELQFTKGV